MAKMKSFASGFLMLAGALSCASLADGYPASSALAAMLMLVGVFQAVVGMITLGFAIFALCKGAN